MEKQIVVIGGGTAGTAAAVAAARRGCSVLLVEEQNCLGGVSTSGGISEFYASLEGLGDIFDCIKNELARFGAMSGSFYNPEYLKWAWQKLAANSGVDILFHATLSGVETKPGRIDSVELTACSRKINVSAGFFIDASGEGDLAGLAGAETMKGDPETGLTLPMSLYAWMFDTGRKAPVFLPEGMEPLNEASDLPGFGAGALLWDGRVYMNVTKIIKHDPTDPLSLSRAEIEARKQLMRIVHYVQRKRFPTYMLGGTGAAIGIREGRRIIGDRILRAEDILDRGSFLDFEDGVSVATGPIDFHSITKQGRDGWREGIKPYSVPIGCLTASGFENLLMAGKCVSVDQTAHSSIRMIPTCCSMGQAAGTAAAMAVESSASDIRDLKVKSLREALTAGGVELDPSRHKEWKRDVPTFLDPGDAGHDRGKKRE